MFNVILFIVLFAYKGEELLELRIHSDYQFANKNLLVMLSVPLGSEGITLYSYNTDKNSLDSAKIPIGRAPEEISFYGLNSIVCDENLVYIYDKHGRKINYYDLKGNYIGQFLLTKSPYYMTGNSHNLILLGPRYIIHINTKSKQMQIREVNYKDFSPVDIWIGTAYEDTAVFIEATKMVLLKFSLKGGEFIGAYSVKGKNEWCAKTVEKKYESGAIGIAVVSSFANIIKYKNYYVLQRRDLEEDEKSVLLFVDDKTFTIKRVVKFPRTAILISYCPLKDEFLIINENGRLAKLTPTKLGIK